MKEAAGVLFRTEAGPEIGFGHLRRSLSLASAFQEKGVRCCFLTSGPRKNLDWIRSFGFSAESVPARFVWTEREAEKTLERCRRWRASTVIVDSPRAGEGYCRVLHRGKGLVVCRDDVGKKRVSAHVLLNGNANAEQLYAQPMNGTLFLLGIDYAVLPKQFWNPPPAVVRRKVREILLLLGGSGSGSLLARLLRCVSGLPGDFSVTVVSGPFCWERDKLRQSIGKAAKEVRWVRSPASLFELMRRADLAVSGAGQTLYELAAVGCPAVAVQVGSDQVDQLRALSEQGCVISVGKVEDPKLFPKLGKALSALMEDDSLRSKMSRAGQRWVDGKGASRVAGKILSHPLFAGGRS